MSKIKNQQKLLLSNYKNIFWIIALIVIITPIVLLQEDIKNSFFEKIQHHSKEKGYILNNIEVLGTEKLSEKIIKSYLINDLNKSIFFISLRKIEKKIISNNWIKSLTLKIKFPSTIIVNIKEKIPVAIYKNEKNEYYYLDQLGNQIDRIGNINKENLIIISGKQSPNDIIKLINSLNYSYNFQVKEAYFIGSRRWDIILNNNLVIKLPENQYNVALKKLNSFFLKIEEFDYSLIEFIDLRILNKAIIRFKNDNALDLLNEM